MVIGWNKKQLEIKAKYANWAAENLAPFADQHDLANTFNHAAWEALAGMGIWEGLLDAPEDADACWDWMAALEGIASHALDSGFVLTVIAQGAFIWGLAQHSSPMAKSWAWPRLREGALTATAIAEPHSGTDTLGSLTVAKATHEGYVLNGTKSNIAHAGSASICLVTSKIEGQAGRGINVFLLDTQRKGFVPQKLNDKMGNRSIPTAGFMLQDVEIESWGLIGEIGKGHLVLGSIGGFARACYAVAAAQLPWPVLKNAISWAAERHSQGHSLLEFQHVQRRFTDVEISLQTAQALGFRAMGALLGNDKQALGLCSIAKIQACNAFRAAMQELVAILGRTGDQRGDAERLLRDAIGWANVGGTEEMHRMIIWKGMSPKSAQ